MVSAMRVTEHPPHSWRHFHMLIMKYRYIFGFSGRQIASCTYLLESTARPNSANAIQIPRAMRNKWDCTFNSYPSLCMCSYVCVYTCMILLRCSVFPLSSLQPFLPEEPTPSIIGLQSRRKLWQWGWLRSTQAWALMQCVDCMTAL